MQRRRKKSTGYRTENTARLLSIAALFAALLLTRLRIHTYHLPFALALLLAITLTDLEPVWTAAGILLGSMIGEISWHAAACAVLFTLLWHFTVLFFGRVKSMIRVLLFLGSLLLTTPLALLYGLQEVGYGLLTIPAVFASAICFAQGLRVLKTMPIAKLWSEWDQDALLLSTGICIMAFYEITVHDVSLSIILLLLLTMLLTSVRGLYGLFAAALLSVAFVLYTKSDVRIVAVATLGAALSVPFSREGKLWIAGGHVVAGLLMAAMQPDPLPVAMLINTALASILFLTIPKPALKWLNQRMDIERQLEMNSRSALYHTKQRTAQELNRMGRLLKDMSVTFDTSTKASDSVEAWTLQGAASICLHCERYATCWKEAESMQQTVMEMAERLENAQNVLPQDPIPPDCASFKDVCASVLLAYQQALMRDAVWDRFGKQNAYSIRTFQGTGDAVDRLAETYRFLPRRNREIEERLFAELCRIGGGVAAVESEYADKRLLLRIYCKEDISITVKQLLQCVKMITQKAYRLVRSVKNEDGITVLLEPAPKWRVQMHVSQAAIVDDHSGDSYGQRKRNGGQSIYALSDGMGSGTEAANESRSAIETLFRLYDAGMGRDMICENVNRMLMAGGESDMYATLDAVSFDLNEGTAELLKFGTPPSYLLRGTTLYTLCGEALPCGIIDDAAPTVIPLTFEQNDILFLLTDGVTDSLTDRLESVLIENASLRDGADRILREAQAGELEDDMSVMLLRVSS